MDIFDNVYAATAYIVDGKETDQLPFDMVANCPKPVLKKYEGWKTDLTGIRQFEDFPASLQLYIRDLEAYLEVPFSIISVGPGREQLVLREAETLV